MTAESNQNDNLKIAFLPSIWPTSESLPLYSRSSPSNYVPIKLAPIDLRNSTSQLSPQRLPPFRELFTDATRLTPFKLSTAGKQPSLPSIQELFYHEQLFSVDLPPSRSTFNIHSPSSSPAPPSTSFGDFLQRLNWKERPVHDFAPNSVDFLPAHLETKSGPLCSPFTEPSNLSFSGVQSQLQDILGQGTAPQVPSLLSRPLPSRARRLEMQPLFTYEPLPGSQITSSSQQQLRTQASETAQVAGVEMTFQRPDYLPPPYASLDSVRADIPDLTPAVESISQTQNAKTNPLWDDPSLRTRKQRRPKTRITSNRRLRGSSALLEHHHSQAPASIQPNHEYDSSLSFQEEKQEMLPPYGVWDEILPGLLDEDESRHKRVNRMRHGRGTMTITGGDL